MSSISHIDKRLLEEIFNMSGGYVLNFSDNQLGDFFTDSISIDIHSEKYQTKGTSKANKLREFWRLEPDNLVGRAILDMIAHVELDISRGTYEADAAKLESHIQGASATAATSAGVL